MAELETKTVTINKTDSNIETPKLPGQWMLLFGVLLPSFVIGFELLTRMCTEAFFDPLPTLAHVPLTLSVPVVNFWLWRSLRSNGTLSPWLPLAGGVARDIALLLRVVLAHSADGRDRRGHGRTRTATFRTRIRFHRRGAAHDYGKTSARYKLHEASMGGRCDRRGRADLAGRTFCRSLTCIAMVGGRRGIHDQGRHLNACDR